MARKIDSATAFQNRLVRQRETEFKREQQWGTTVKYYDQMSRKNNKYEAWTSPRYYESNNKLVGDLKRDRDKKDLLESRKEKLKQLLYDEEEAYKVELIVKNRHKMLKPDNTKCIPTEILSEINLGLKQAEDNRKRHEAEVKLYHSWRSNNPVLRDYERRYRAKDIKFSWLDQQIEKRIKREEDEKRHKRFLKEREARLDEQQQLEETLQQDTRRKNDLLHLELAEQMAELKLKNQFTDELKQREYEEISKQSQLEELESKLQAEKNRRKDRELALFNLKQHKLKLKQKIVDINSNLENEQELIHLMLKQDLASAILEEDKRLQVRTAMEDFLDVTRQQKELEKRREHFLSFIFDSEAKEMYQKQLEIWSKEQEAREGLLTDVLITIRSQIKDNLEKNRQKQRDLIEQKHDMLDSVQRTNEAMIKNKEDAEAKKMSYRKELDDQVKENIIRKEQTKLEEQKKIEREMELITKEEERLNKEIRKLQAGKVNQRSYGKQKTQFLLK